jgi:hypothetical protein
VKKKYKRPEQIVRRLSELGRNGDRIQTKQLPAQVVHSLAATATGF